MLMTSTPVPGRPVSDSAMLALALLCCPTGLGWFALAMDVHWQQVCGTQSPGRRVGRVLRTLGGLALFASLLICLHVNHASIAALVWFMALAASALLIAITLSYRPRLLTPLVAWIRV